MARATFEPHAGKTLFSEARRLARVRARAIPVILLLPLLAAGCTGGEDEPAPIVVTEEEYLGGGLVELDDDTGGGSLWVDVGANVTSLRMEVVYSAIASVNPRVFGLPECEWRLFTTHTETRTETIDCAVVVPGHHEIRVEHDGGELHMAVRVLGRVPRAEG